ncbi:glycosyltransferase [Candidatus Woesearchaeota archaeon]|nr:glycosyltransferase [Candidatus Woesearchaeota archaeon]
MTDLSVLVPVYNEERRGKEFLQRLVDFVDVHLKDSELLLVNDGSSDGTLDMLRTLGKGKDFVKIISYQKNRGKAFAVKEGVLAAKGSKVIFIDADGSIPPEEIPRMRQLLDKYEVVVGNRAHRESIIDQPLTRETLGRLFNLYARLLFNTRVSDHLCGFKGFRLPVARHLFSKLVSDRWVFDVELFYRIRRERFSLVDMPIRWVHKAGSKIRMFDPLKMFVQLLWLRLRV